jgi:hypothetical protein
MSFASDKTRSTQAIVWLKYAKHDSQFGFQDIDKHYHASQESEKLLCCCLRDLLRDLLKSVRTSGANHKQILVPSTSGRQRMPFTSGYPGNLQASFEVLHDAME